VPSLYLSEASPVDSLCVTGDGSGPCLRRLFGGGGDRRDWRFLFGSFCSPCEYYGNWSVSAHIRPYIAASGCHNVPDLA